MSEVKTTKSYRAEKMPTGVKRPGGKLKIAVSLDQAVFDDIVRNAQRQKIDFSQSINDVAKCGILCLKEAGEL